MPSDSAPQDSPFIDYVRKNHNFQPDQLKDFMEQNKKLIHYIFKEGEDYSLQLLQMTFPLVTSGQPINDIEPTLKQALLKQYSICVSIGLQTGFGHGIATLIKNNNDTKYARDFIMNVYNSFRQDIDRILLEFVEKFKRYILLVIIEVCSSHPAFVKEGHNPVQKSTERITYALHYLMALATLYGYSVGSTTLKYVLESSLSINSNQYER